MTIDRSATTDAVIRGYANALADLSRAEAPGKGALFLELWAGLELTLEDLRAAGVDDGDLEEISKRIEAEGELRGA